MKRIIAFLFLLVLNLSLFANPVIKQGDVQVELTTGFENKITIESPSKRYSTIFDVKLQNPVVCIAYLDRDEVRLSEVSRPNVSFTLQGANKNTVRLRHGDYAEKKTGFAQGHLISNEFFNFNEDLTKETFSLYNIGPQYTELNKAASGGHDSAWYKLEQQEDAKANTAGRLYMIVGEVFDEKPKTFIGAKTGTEIAIPSAFYKIYIYYNEDEDVKDFYEIHYYRFENTKKAETDPAKCLEISGYTDTDTLNQALRYIEQDLNLKITLTE